ncbi:MAG: HutD family protein, partial [Tissierella sp.]|uniref:HutD family protein n=1 Tax=Tissierella sp. TaxID=41274 RepID=UPI003F9A3F0E
MKYNVNIIKKEDYKVSNWSGGKTTEMYIYPEDSDYKKRDFYFRISSASVELSESDFTKLEGVKRWITTLDGDLKLSHDYKSFINLKPFEIYEFKGDIETHSYGKVQDFNLMLANGAQGELENISLNKKKNIKISDGNNKYDFNIFYCPHNDVSIFIE